MELLSKKNRSVKSLLSVIDVFTKYAWVKPLKAFIEIMNQSNRKPSKLWVDQGR